MILVYLGRLSYGRFQDDNNIFYKMKNDLTTGTWQDNIWCPIIIILFCTSDVCFLKEKLCLLCHSLPFTTVPGIIVVHMVLHIIKFVNGFPCWGGVKHFSPGEIMTGHCLHKSNIPLSFGVYCQVTENVQPQNSLAPWTQAAISVGSSGNLSGGQVFLALDTGHTIIRH